jgi:hypothetical protein
MVIVIPGLLVASIIGLRLRALLTWAAIPAFSIAAVFLLGEAAMVLRLPFGLPAFGLLLFVLGGALAVVRSRRAPLSRVHGSAQGADRTQAPIETRLEERVDYVLLALGVAVGVLTWFRGLRGVPLIPPGGDATRHGWFVARILFGQTIDPSQVLTYDVGGAHSTTHYYPLALHASAALSTRLVGADVGRVLVAYIVVFSAVVLPVGMFVLARTLAPTRPLVAGFTALVVPLMMLFPYEPVWGGDLPLVVAMTMVPAAVVLLRRAMLARRPRVQLNRAFVAALAPSALAVLCIISVHATELSLVVFLALLLVLERAWRKHDVRMLQPALVRGVAVGAFATALFAPTLVSFAQGVFERAPARLFVAENPANWQLALGAILQLHYGASTVRQGFLAVLALTGAALWLLWRRPAWVAGWVGVVFLALFASASTNRFADHLTFPWYHLAFRIVPNVAFFVPFFAGVTLAYGAVLITRLARRPSAILPATLVMVAVLTQFVGLHGFRADSAYIQASFDPNTRSFTNQAVVAHTSLAAFRWLHDHVARGDTVANEPGVDGSLWMYAQQHVAPLIGYFDPGNHNLSPELADRLYLSRHVQWLGIDTRADDVSRRYHTRWVFFDTNVMPTARHIVNLAALLRNRSLTVVFHDGGTWVFRNDLAEPSGATESPP